MLMARDVKITIRTRNSIVAALWMSKGCAAGYGEGYTKWTDVGPFHNGEEQMSGVSSYYIGPVAGTEPATMHDTSLHTTATPCNGGVPLQGGC